jgi:hypothetical protein
MKNTEIRIGNYVYRNDILVTVDEQTFWDMKNNPEQYKPVRLTEDLLVRFGFEKYTWMDGYFMKTKFGHLMIQFYRDEIHLYFTNVGANKDGLKMTGRKYIGNLNSTQNIKHVHQLQNLYFALTNKELKA